jgi:hypothetical protein
VHLPDGQNMLFEASIEEHAMQRGVLQTTKLDAWCTLNVAGPTEARRRHAAGNAPSAAPAGDASSRFEPCDTRTLWGYESRAGDCSWSVKFLRYPACGCYIRFPLEFAKYRSRLLSPHVVPASAFYILST